MKMKPSRKYGSKTSVLDSSVTFESFRFLKSKPLSKTPNDVKFQELHKNLNFALSKSSTNVQSVLFSSKKFKNTDFKFSDVDSNITSISQVQKNVLNKGLSSDYLKRDESTNSRSVFTNVEEDKYESYDGNNSALSIPTQEVNSDESFLTMMTRTKRKFEFINPKEEFPDFSKALRLFNKNGKPLTDRMGRPLVDILGQPLVVLDNQGRLISDSRGNQVFNTLGESAIYSNTNLYLPPSGEEPGIPLLDIDKKHVLFLYDNKGHPLTDSLGRPLIKASGSLMIGMDSKSTININLYQEYQLKSLYSKAPLENFVRRVQIFDSKSQPLTDENGKVLKEASIICNKGGMPLCDRNGHPLFFKYGARIITPQPESPNIENHKEFEETHHESSTKEEIKKTGDSLNIVTNINQKEQLQRTSPQLNLRISGNKKCNKNYSALSDISTGTIKENPENKDTNNTGKIANIYHKNDWLADENKIKIINNPSNTEPQNESGINPPVTELNNNVDKFRNFTKASLQIEENSGVDNKNISSEAIVIFNASENMKNRKKSSMNTAALNCIKGRQAGYNIMKRKLNKNMYSSSFMQYFKNVLNLTGSTQNNKSTIYNGYGKPVKDFYGNLLYDKFGIPLTGAKGRKLSDKVRHTLRMKLRNIPVQPINKENTADGKKIIHALTNNESHDQFGNPYYDKYGRPLYDIYGNLIYDTFGRPLTDAYGRPLIDGIGQPLMDSQGNVLTAGITTSLDTIPTDLFGRRLYDKRGRSLFDSYGRPRFDIYTNAIYDSYGRPTTDGNGNILNDFLNKPIQPCPEKPLCKNARALLPSFIDRILVMPSLRRVLKYSRTSLTDVFGGPLFDDFGRPLYNKIGKPLYDKYGRPLYDKDAKPLCDSYGRPVSEEIRQSPDDQTLTVVDSLKLLKLTKESNKWMEVKRSQTHNLKSTDSGILDKAFIMKVVQPGKNKSTQYTYALTRVTTFSCGRQALEILEAPLSPSTANEMHNLPVDNKPLIMMAKRRRKVTKTFWLRKHHH
ncbi:hypothetical protein J6590_037176 [Homalodisca vitripennis]|nr:hypothetical protein J6590_037176 [Homalodisca vitripennis]